MKKWLLSVAVITVALVSCKKDKKEPPKTIPLVQTAALTNQGNGNYKAGGSIVSDGGAVVTQSGIVWSKTNNTPVKGTDSLVASTATNGAFTTDLTGIDFNATYYVRAFATNSVGTGYGNVVTLTTSTDSVRFTYNGQSVTYGIITSPTTGKKWLDRNLGAKQAATAYNDYQAYGDLFQWGRPADGHQLMSWTASNAGTSVNGITNTIATSDSPGHNSFIDGTANYNLATGAGGADWRDNNNRNRWNTNAQGPCPAGWHVPTMDEWAAESSPENSGGGGNGFGTASSGGIKDRNTAFTILKLTVSGLRRGYGSAFNSINSRCFYWGSGDVLHTNGYTVSRSLEVGNNYVQSYDGAFKSNAMSVRCVKD